MITTLIALAFSCNSSTLIKILTNCNMLGYLYGRYLYNLLRGNLNTLPESNEQGAPYPPRRPDNSCQWSSHIKDSSTGGVGLSPQV